MPNYFQGTINTLSNLTQNKQQANLAKETPQYQQALFNLVQAKQQAIQQQQFRDMLINADPKDIPGLVARFTGDPTSFLNQRKEADQRAFEVNEAVETFEGLKPTDLDFIERRGRLPNDALPRIKVREKSPTTVVNVGEGKFEAARATALGSASGKASADLAGIEAIKNDVTNVLETFLKIPDTFRGPAAGRTLGVIGKLGANDDVVTYEDTKELTLSNIAKKLGGEVGVLTDRDIERIKKSLPSLKDSPKTAQDKVNFILNYVDRRIKAKQKVAGMNVTGLSLPKEIFNNSFNKIPVKQQESIQAQSDSLDNYLNDLGL